MKKCFIYLFISFIATAFTPIMGQMQTNHPVCGTTIEDQAELGKHLRQNRANPALAIRTGDPIYIPMIFHLVAKKDGSGRFDRLDKVLNAICKLNEDYGAQGIIFYLDNVTESIKELNHNAAYDNPKAAFGSNKLRSTANKPENHKAVNVFVVKDIKDGNNPGEILGYYTKNGDYVVMKEKEIRSPSSTFAHELGHYFSLMHTFYGWEERTYKYEEPTPTAIIYAGKTILTEYVSRTKMKNGKRLCEIAADQLCDTEANYKLGYGYPGCDWNGKAKDPDNVPLDPQERNYMSYFLRCNDYTFTKGQGDAMKRDYYSNRREYLRVLPPPDVSEPGTTTLRFPENNQELDYYDVVKLDWDDAPNATHYLVERASRKSFSTGVETYITDKSEIVLTDLAKSKFYYWRVTPLNETHLCGEHVGPYKFKTGNSKYNATKDLNGIETWSIGNNPANPAQLPYLLIRTSKAWDGQLSISSVTGKTLSSRKLSLRQGTKTVVLQNITVPGVYFITLSRNGASDTKKLLVVK